MYPLELVDIDDTVKFQLCSETHITGVRHSFAQALRNIIDQDAEMSTTGSYFAVSPKRRCKDEIFRTEDHMETWDPTGAAPLQIRPVSAQHPQEVRQRLHSPRKPILSLDSLCKWSRLCRWTLPEQRPSSSSASGVGRAVSLQLVIRQIPRLLDREAGSDDLQKRCKTKRFNTLLCFFFFFCNAQRRERRGFKISRKNKTTSHQCMADHYLHRHSTRSKTDSHKKNTRKCPENIAGFRHFHGI